MKRFQNHAEFESWLAQKGMFHMELGPERMITALRHLSLPKMSVIQVLGTNGKGSTSAFLEYLARAHGLVTGLYISPHFLSPKERILINGQQPDNATWLEAANAVLPLDKGLTYFEFLTLMALHIFSQTNCDIIILEAGLGGANDATSTIPAEIHCFTPVAMDHAHVIGPSISDIAKDKAMAIQHGTQVFSAPQYPDVWPILSNECHYKNAQLIQTEGCPYPTGMNGKTQQINAGLALEAWRSFARNHSTRSMPHLEAHAISSSFLPGRMQHLAPTATHAELTLDGAHNPHAIQALIRQLQNKPDAIIFSALSDKNWAASLALLMQLDCPLYIPQLHNARAESCWTMANHANRIIPDSANSFKCLEDALMACKNEQRSALLTGSLYLLAEFYSLFPHYLHKDQS